MKTNSKYYLLFVFCLAFLLLMVSSNEAEAEITIEDARRTVMRVVTFPAGADPHDGNVMTIGSGFVIGTEPPFEYVATNLHLPEPWRYPALQWPEEAPRDLDIYVYRSRDDLVKVTIYFSLPEVDMALLKVDPNHLLYDYAPLPLARADMVNVNDNVRAIGFPYEAGLGFPLPDDFQYGLDDFPAAYPQDTTVTDGIISKELTIRGVGYYQTTAALNPGTSGGPLLNEDLEVIGMASITTWADDIHAAFRIDYLTEALRFRGIDYLKAYHENDEPTIDRERVSFTDLPATIESGDEVILRASVSNLTDEPRDLDVRFSVNGSLITSERLFQIAPGQSETVSTPWSTDTAGDYRLEVTAGLVSHEQILRVERGVWWPPDDNIGLIIGLGAAALLLIVLAIALVSRGRKPAAAIVSPTPTPSAQQATLASGPVTRTKPEGAPGAPPAVTQARRQQPRPVIKGVSGYFANQTLELVDNQLTIGRDPRLAQLVYPQQREEISRKHLTIRFDEKTHKFNLTDSSSNGTFLSSNQKLEPGEAYYLNSGDRFYLAEPNEVFEVKVES